MSTIMRATKAVGAVLGVLLTMVIFCCFTLAVLIGFGSLAITVRAHSFPKLGMEIILHPLILFEIVLGCIVGALPRWPILRILSWFVIPAVIALTYSIADGLFTAHGESGFFAAMGIVVLLPVGFLAYGAALLVGYLLRKAFKYCEAESHVF